MHGADGMGDCGPRTCPAGSGGEPGNVTPIVLQGRWYREAMAVLTDLAPRDAVLNEARRAAQAMAAARSDVVKVMLFGSVARGEASEASDIDLVVVIDDLGDYKDRREVRDRLAEAVRDSTPCSVDLHVTDLPEWKVRTEQVSASFEASIADDLVTLVERPVRRRPEWGKRLGRPATNLEEAGSRFSDVARQLRSLNREMLPDENELVGDALQREREWKERRRTACGRAADVIEAAVKTVIALGGVSPIKTHDLAELVEQIEPPEQRAQVVGLLQASPVPVDSISAWHVKSNYANDVETQWADAANQLASLVQLAHDMAVHADRAFTAADGDPVLSRSAGVALRVLQRDAPAFTGRKID